MPVITGGRMRSNIRWPFVVLVAVMAHPLAFLEGHCPGRACASGGTNAFAANLARGRSLVCDAEQRAKKKRPDGSRRFSQIVLGSSLDYFPFLAAAFLSAFFIFFAIMISFSHLLLKTVLVGLRQTCNPIPCSPSTDEQRHCQEKS